MNEKYAIQRTDTLKVVRVNTKDELNGLLSDFRNRNIYFVVWKFNKLAGVYAIQEVY